MNIKVVMFLVLALVMVAFFSTPVFAGDLISDDYTHTLKVGVGAVKTIGDSGWEIDGRVRVVIDAQQIDDFIGGDIDQGGEPVVGGEVVLDVIRRF